MHTEHSCVADIYRDPSFKPRVTCYWDARHLTLSLQRELTAISAVTTPTLCLPSVSCCPSISVVWSRHCVWSTLSDGESCCDQWVSETSSLRILAAAAKRLATALLRFVPTSAPWIRQSTLYLYNYSAINRRVKNIHHKQLHFCTMSQICKLPRLSFPHLFTFHNSVLTLNRKIF